MPRILLIQGANMCWLGKREPEVYGTTTAAEVDEMVRAHAKSKGYDIEIFYTNSQGACMDRIYRTAQEGMEALVMNPGGFTHYGATIADTLRAVKPLPYVEIHISNQAARGFPNLTSKVADCVIYGIGVFGYLLALEAALHLIEKRRAV